MSKKKRSEYWEIEKANTQGILGLVAVAVAMVACVICQLATGIRIF